MKNKITFLMILALALSPLAYAAGAKSELFTRNQPGGAIIVNNRNLLPGDFGTPEQEIRAEKEGTDWEACMTMNETWGYRKDDHHWKTTQTLVRNLINCASKGGNYLLNIGPTAEGVFPDACIERLQDIGKWMKVNHQAIYGTQASPASIQTTGSENA